ncbi:methionine adenosyltransferase [Pigmentibacter ruber]|uniref:methionine adenosyltransferase n=1 Tax=Pigmentibacter ruber TaxID=2683196 RepID=UPI00131DE755|nr:methionine adenosyltransferase [Pigmentibacter ruber]BFD30493.1 methionine adenosyltransferase [Pigmentibacter ruber]
MFQRSLLNKSFSPEVTYFTSESVSEGHPDKVADQISDGILDELLTFDPKARVACEALCKTGLVVIAGEITVNPETVHANELKLKRKMKSYSDIARNVIKEIGYNDPNNGFEYRSCGVIVAIDQQSPDIAQGVNEGEGLHKEQGAGDQGMMFGYATNETPEFMPATLQYAHSILRNLSKARKEGTVNWLRPDAKSQVTVEYHDGKMKRIDTVVVSTMHSENVSQQEIKEFVIEKIIKNTIPQNLLDSNTKYHINPTGKFVIGGPQGDCGLTGRKIIVDTYGGHGAHGGGAFSGKDPSKVDRSAAYMGRYIAKNIVAAGLAERALVQIAYAIGVAQPVSVNVNTFGTEKVARIKIEEAVQKVFNMTPAGIVKTFNLLNPQENGYTYHETASYGHFGRSNFPWEKTDKVQELKKFV